MVGGMGVRKNIHIEEWAAFRENCEHVFKFSRGNWARLAVFGFAVPALAYYGITRELRLEGHPVGNNPRRQGAQFRYFASDVPK
ncbi:unnamed protein product [Chondrus crispus]|uniref:NADH dehydrogenase [ubiquinone] 1 beta subcomplex subunit 4 n=1 Tax=Chondrus crispus TaxID=2769 RepID=R7Q7K6_CHOCR|nr:unnamed protein product [Chondrus crispus]CDF33823.1 unnamed protein product [Chondrus crispus]|eukprot:XP_005713642.1 unnamed protein product [Chondrus crispus]